MTLTLFLQAFLLPVLAALVAAFTKRFYPIVLVAAFWCISLWVKGTTIEAMDSVAIALTLSIGFLFLAKAMATRWLVVTQVGLLAVLSVWQVKNFATSISPVTWAIQGAFLVGVVCYSWWIPLPAALQQPKSFFARLTVHHLFLLIPIGYLAILSPLAGSILVGQMAGLVALFALAVWSYQGFGVATGRQLAIFVAAPTLFVAQMAYHYVEIPWTSLAIGLIGWLPLLWRRFTAQTWWLQLLCVAAIYALLLAVGLYIEWPEQSLY